MPLKLGRDDRRVLLLVAAVLVVTLVLAALFAQSSDEHTPEATTYSTAPEGVKAAYLLLRESGYNCNRLEVPAGDLKPENTLLIIADPTVNPSPAEQQAILNFVSNGGRVILTGPSGVLVLPSYKPPAESGIREWDTFSAVAPSSAALSAPSIQMKYPSAWNADTGGVVLYGSKGRAAVTQYAVGKGQVIWLGSSSLLSNEGLRQPDNLNFLLAIIGDRQTHVLWDEYLHGHGSEASEPTANPQLLWIAAQLGLLAGVVLLTYSRRSGPQRAPLAESRLSPLEFVQALGELYSTARAANVAVDIYYGRFRYWLTRRLGMSPSASPENLGEAVNRRWGIPPGDFIALITRCESARFFTDLTRSEALELTGALYRYAEQMRLFPAPREEND